MEKIIAACGNDCSICPRHMPKTDIELYKTAELWYRIGYRDRVVSNEESGAGLPPVLLTVKKQPKKTVKKAFEEYSEAERGEIVFWCKIVEEWQNIRAAGGTRATAR